MSQSNTLDVGSGDGVLVTETEYVEAPLDEASTARSVNPSLSGLINFDDEAQRQKRLEMKTKHKAEWEELRKKQLQERNVLRQKIKQKRAEERLEMLEARQGEFKDNPVAIKELFSAPEGYSDFVSENYTRYYDEHEEH